MEVYPGRGVHIFGFLVTIKQRLHRLHPSIRALVVADQAIYLTELLDEQVKSFVPVLENISHGQIQTLSTMHKGEQKIVGSSSYGSLGR